MPRTLALAALLVLGLTSVRAQDDGFKPLFNGKDLAGWHNVNGAPGTFFVKDDMIITTGKPTGYLRTDKQYENFIAEFEWYARSQFQRRSRQLRLLRLVRSHSRRRHRLHPRHRSAGPRQSRMEGQENRQITATSQGDLFSIWGATCEPDRPHPLGWER